MKKRKPPIVAVTILLICGAVIIGYNYKAGINPKAVPDKPAVTQDTDAKLGNPRATKDASTLAGQVKNQVSNMPSRPPMKGGPGGMMGKMGMNPIEMPKPGSNKPVPNDTAVSSQWYQPDSSKSGQ